MDFLPISLKLQHQPCLIVGGGAIAYRKAQLLVKAGAIITVIAPTIHDDLLALVVASKGQYIAREFQADIALTEYRLVIAATN